MRADVVTDVERAAIVSYRIHVDARDLESGIVVSRDIESPATGGPFVVGDPVPAEAYDVADALGVDTSIVSGGARCRPGGYDLYAYIEAKNILNDTVLRFHTDTEFYYDCKKVTAIPFVLVYGSDYHYFWEWDRTLAKEKHGVGTKTGTVVGAGAFKQCMNYGFGEACTAHASYKITWHMFGNGSVTAAGH